MEKEVVGNFLAAFEEAKEKFAQCNPEEMAAKSGASFKEGFFSLTYCGKEHLVIFPAGEVIGPEGERVLLSDKILILQYLAQADGTPPQGKWLTLRELPGGFSHAALFQKEAISPLLETFAGKREKFREALAKLGGKGAELGDYGGIIPVFPRVFLGVLFWEGDAEFPPSADILFDAASLHYLDTAALYVLGVNTALKLCRNA